jgi:hypothetical protein
MCPPLNFSNLHHQSDIEILPLFSLIPLNLNLLGRDSREVGGRSLLVVLVPDLGPHSVQPSLPILAEPGTHDGISEV